MPSLEDLQFNREHRRELPLGNLEVDREETNLGQLYPDNSLRGDKIGTLEVGKLTAGSLNVNEYIQSTGFVAGSAGWQIKGDGTSQFKDITLIGGTLKYGKTSFADSTNAGYWVGADGFYFGSAADTKYLKYAIATGTFTQYGTTFDTGQLVNVLTLGDGTTNSGRITLNIADGHGDCYIAAGKSDFSTTDNGFIIGVDDSDSNKVKAYFGNDTDYLYWDGTSLNGAGILSPTIKLTAGENLKAGNAVFIHTDGLAFLTDATIVETCNQYIGIVTANVNSPSTATIQLAGYYNGFAGLTISSAYYLKDEVAISNTSVANVIQMNNNTTWYAQTIKTGSSTIYNKISASLEYITSNNGTFTLSIKAVDGANKPTGLDLWSYTGDLSSLTADPVWYDYTLSSLVLSAATTYALVFRRVSGTGIFACGRDNTANYADGVAWTSADSGETWSSAGAWDIDFKLWSGGGEISTSAGSTSKKIGIATSTTKFLMLNS